MKIGDALFLPAAGERVSGALNMRGWMGYYWSSTTYNGTHNYDLGFGSSGGPYMSQYGNQSTGLPVRCVAQYIILLRFHDGADIFFAVDFDNSRFIEADVSKELSFPESRLPVQESLVEN
ncbi:MAG: hypothetical protein LBM08_00005, partial [Dysgonamonadaceae bacterium]|nr:hypothetical protein [Dysgonamonadaceae bacterium]